MWSKTGLDISRGSFLEYASVRCSYHLRCTLFADDTNISLSTKIAQDLGYWLYKMGNFHFSVEKRWIAGFTIALIAFNLWLCSKGTDEFLEIFPWGGGEGHFPSKNYIADFGPLYWALKRGFRRMIFEKYGCALLFWGTRFKFVHHCPCFCQVAVFDLGWDFVAVGVRSSPLTTKHLWAGMTTSLDRRENINMQLAGWCSYRFWW